MAQLNVPCNVSGVTGTHCTGGWVDLRAGLDSCGKFLPPGFNPKTVQPIGSRYTDYATRPTIYIYIITRVDFTEYPPKPYINCIC